MTKPKPLLSPPNLSLRMAAIRTAPSRSASLIGSTEKKEFRVREFLVAEGGHLRPRRLEGLAERAVNNL